MGELHLIVGCMFSGKTTRLINIANSFKSIDRKVIIINYKEDTRYSSNRVTSHDLNSSTVDTIFLENIDSYVFTEMDVICINEAQFFKGLKNYCIRAVNAGKIVYVSGLDGDFKQDKFGEIIDLIPICDSIEKLSALCKLCKNGNKAFFTQRITKETTQKLIGTHQYIPVCRYHLNDTGKN